MDSEDQEVLTNSPTTKEKTEVQPSTEAIQKAREEAASQIIDTLNRSLETKAKEISSNLSNMVKEEIAKQLKQRATLQVEQAKSEKDELFEKIIQLARENNKYF